MKVAQAQLYQPLSGFGALAQPDRAKVTTRWEGGREGSGRDREDAFMSPDVLH